MFDPTSFYSKQSYGSQYGGGAQGGQASAQFSGAFGGLRQAASQGISGMDDGSAMSAMNANPFGNGYQPQNMLNNPLPNTQMGVGRNLALNA